MSRDNALPAWPTAGSAAPIVNMFYMPGTRPDLDAVAAEYFRGAALFWEARCRIAIAALSSIYDVEHDTDGDRAHQALVAIGPLPRNPA